MDATCKYNVNRTPLRSNDYQIGREKTDFTFRNYCVGKKKKNSSHNNLKRFRCVTWYGGKKIIIIKRCFESRGC